MNPLATCGVDEVELIGRDARHFLLDVLDRDRVRQPRGSSLVATV